MELLQQVIAYLESLEVFDGESRLFGSKRGFERKSHLAQIDDSKQQKSSFTKVGELRSNMDPNLRFYDSASQILSSQ